MLLAVLVVMALEWPKLGFRWARKSKLGFLVQTQLGDGRVEPRTGSGQGARVGYPLEKRGKCTRVARLGRSTDPRVARLVGHGLGFDQTWILTDLEH